MMTRRRRADATSTIRRHRRRCRCWHVPTSHQRLARLYTVRYHNVSSETHCDRTLYGKNHYDKNAL